MGPPPPPLHYFVRAVLYRLDFSASFGLSASMGDENRTLLAALDLMRRMPPSRMETSLEGAH